jgi:hypothetical protein
MGIEICQAAEVLDDQRVGTEHHLMHRQRRAAGEIGTESVDGEHMHSATHELGGGIGGQRGMAQRGGTAEVCRPSGVEDEDRRQALGQSAVEGRLDLGHSVGRSRM